MNINYTKQFKIKKKCLFCNGTGIMIEKVYHNDYQEVKCHMCKDGYIIETSNADATNEVNLLKKKIKNYRNEIKLLKQK
jgi:hypothetical protein